MADGAVVLELTEDVVGVGRKGGRVLVDADDPGEWAVVVVHRLHVPAGKLLALVHAGALEALSDNAPDVLARMARKGA